MRKIISKKEEQKKNRMNQIAVGGILILIMLLSTIGYSFISNPQSNSEKVTYNGIEFIFENSLWNANLGDYQFSFLYKPNEAEKINSSLKLLNNYNNAPLYIYSENSDAITEIYRNLFYNNGVVERMQEACFEGGECVGEMPIKNCSSNFIIIKISENKEIRQEENCVFISGNYDELVNITDGFLLKIIGIQ